MDVGNPYSPYQVEVPSSAAFTKQWLLFDLMTVPAGLDSSSFGLVRCQTCTPTGGTKMSRKFAFVFWNAQNLQNIHVHLLLKWPQRCLCFIMHGFKDIYTLQALTGQISPMMHHFWHAGYFNMREVEMTLKGHMWPRRPRYGLHMKITPRMLKISLFLPYNTQFLRYRLF